MGKAARWFRGLLGLKKPETPSSAAEGSGSKPPKRRWSFVKSRKDRGTRTDRGGGGGDGRPAAGPGGEDANRHAIAVAAATAAVAEAAVAAAQAAAAAVKLTGSGRPCAVAPAHVRERGAVRIQAAFRAYLSRRALRALRGLVKLQALVRGHIIRKQTADMLRGIQALLRAQARARVGRAQRSESPLSSSKSSQLQCPDPATPEKFEQAIRVKSLKHERSSSMLKRSGSKNKTCLMDKSNNIHEANPNRRSSDQRSHSFTTSKDSTARQTAPSSSSCEVQSLTPLKLSHEVEESSPFCSASSSPQFISVSSKAGSSRTGPFTPAKSDGSRSFLSSSYSNYPNYMSCTESSRAKVRSYSAPKQRPQYERSSSTKKNSIQGFGDSKPSAHRVSALHANFTNKAYPGSGRLDRLGMPLAYDHGPFPNRY